VAKLGKIPVLQPTWQEGIAIVFCEEENSSLIKLLRLLLEKQVLGAKALTSRLKSTILNKIYTT
jgi:hypothetical protein